MTARADTEPYRPTRDLRRAAIPPRKAQPRPIRTPDKETPRRAKVGLNQGLIQGLLPRPRLFFFPLRIGLIQNFSLDVTIIGLMFLLAGGIWIAVKREKNISRIAVGTAWFVLLSLPGMMYRHEMGSNAYDYLTHRMYLPLVGILILAIEALPSNWYCVSQKLKISTTAVLIATLSALSWYYSGFFLSAERFDLFV